LLIRYRYTVLSLARGPAQRATTEDSKNASDLTKQNAKICHEAVNEIFEALPKTKKMENIGNLNEVLLFLEKATRELPDEGSK
jgi:hypothetical protein